MARGGPLPRLALDVHVGDRRVREPRLQVLADQLVLLEELREVVARVIARAPLLDDPQAEPVRMRFLAHLSSPFLGSRRGRPGLPLRGGLRRPPLALGGGLRLRPPLPRPPVYGPGYGDTPPRH